MENEYLLPNVKMSENNTCKQLAISIMVQSETNNGCTRETLPGFFMPGRREPDALQTKETLLLSGLYEAHYRTV